MDSSTLPIQNIVFGDLHRDYVISTDGISAVDIPGGSALYCAIGTAVWKRNRVGIVAQVGNDFPISKLFFLRNYGINIDGVQVLPHPLDNRAFHSGINEKESPQIPPEDYPILEMELRRALLGYQKSKRDIVGGKNQPINGFIKIPGFYSRSHLAHFCSAKHDYLLSQTALIQSQFPGRISQFVSDVPVEKKKRELLLDSINNLLCVVIKKDSLKGLFNLNSEDNQEVLKIAMRIKSEFVIVLLGGQGRLLMEPRTRKAWFVPLYPVRSINPTGKNHAFCGGFAATILDDYDPLEAILAGAVSSSLVAEGIGLKYPLEAPLRLLESRLSHLRGLVRSI